MPCAGPSPSEILEDECRTNERLYGIHASDLDIATRVACHLAKGERNKLVQKWIVELTYAERWDGKLPSVTGGAVPFVNVDSMK